jgi:hypothetical protein
VRLTTGRLNRAPLARQMLLRHEPVGVAGAFHTAMAHRLRASGLRGRRFTESGLSTADVDQLLPHLLDFAVQPRTRPELEELCATRLGTMQPRAWWG